MKAIRSMILSIIAVAVSVGMGLCVSIYGWGLTPHSWGWILCGNLAGFCMGQFFVALAKEK